MISLKSMRLRVWAVAFLTLVSGALPAVGWSAERSLAELLDELQHPREGGARVRAVEALAQYGEHAVPALRGLLGDEDQLVRSYACVALVRIGPGAEAALPDLVNLGGDQGESEDLREIAILALGQIGPQAAPAVPMLQAVLREVSSSKLRRETVCALAAIATPDAVATLIELLEHGGQQDQQAVLFACSAQRVHTKPVAAALLAFGTRHPNSRTGDEAFMTVTAFGREAVVELLPYLRAEELETRRRAALALARLGPDATAAVPALCDALQDEADSVRFWAAKALGNVGPGARPAIVALRQVLHDADPNVRWEATTAIAKIDPAALTENDWNRLLSDPDPGVRQRAAAIRSASL